MQPDRLCTKSTGVQFSSVQFSSVQMASLVVPLFLTPPARAIGRARRGATGMAGRAVLAWSSYRQGRASSARGPPLTSSGVLAFWDRQGPVKTAMAAGAAAARAFEGVTECAPRPAYAPSHACVCARDTGACNMLWVQLCSRRCLRRTLRESSRERRVGGGAGGSSSEPGGSNWRGRRTDDWRRTKRARTELSGVGERVIGLRHLVGCGTGPLTRAGHLGERDAAPTGLELFGQSPAFSPQSPHYLSIFSSISICTLRARRLAPCGVSPPGLLPVRAPSVVSHHLRRLSPPLLASRAHSIGFRSVVCCLCSN